MASRSIVWFRNNLRLHDNEVLQRASELSDEIVPVYFLDDRQFGKTSFGFPKTGRHRAQFLLESLSDLRERLRSMGSDLLIRHEYPEVALPELVRTFDARHVVFQDEVGTEERAVEQAVTAALADRNCEAVSVWDQTLFHPKDLPFAIEQLPELFSKFRRKVESNSTVRPECASEQRMSPISVGDLKEVDRGEIPSLDALCGNEPTTDSSSQPSGVLTFRGGETEALARLEDYIWTNDCLRTYKETRNGMLGPNYSSKFSAWLSTGCLSPRRVSSEVDRYESERVANDSTYWLIFELIWRDYFRFIVAKHGRKVFRPAGLRGVVIPWQQDWERFELWKSGRTGFPLVDANMRELAATGFMSNRGRQNVGSFLTKNLGIDWRMGAEWFESQLIDYDVCSNWGNWNYTAGVGNDARGFRFFNIHKQASQYDRDGDYVRHWLPELEGVSGGKIHQPWELHAAEQKRADITIGVDYPNPVVDLFKSADRNRELYDQAFHR
jgi:deoxyribodipyrimidine photo-lyase